MRDRILNPGDSPPRSLLAALLCRSRALPLLLSLLACGGPEAVEFPLAVLALTDSDSPLGGVRFAVEGKDAGTTDSSGLLRIRARGLEGDTIRLRATCPHGYRETRPVRRFALRGFDRLEDTDQAAVPRIIWRCLPVQRLAALVVRSDSRQGLPVIAGGREVARTGPAGVAHALLRLAPGSSLTVTLDTEDRPRLRPRNPQRTFQIEDRDTLLIFDQRFSQKRENRRRADDRARPRQQVPYRIR